MRLLILLCVVSFFSFVADGQDFARINSIKIEGNTRTSESVILFELGISVGDTLTNQKISETLSKAENRILNTALFNRVDIEMKYVTESDRDLVVKVSERWYFWLVPVVQFQDPSFSTWSEDRDLKRINFGGDLLHRNISGSADELGLRVAFGFSNEASLFYSRPYLGKTKKGKIQAEIWSKQVNKVHAFNDADDRFFVEAQDDNLLKKYGGALGYQYRFDPIVSVSGKVLFESIKLNEVEGVDVLGYLNYFGEREEVLYTEFNVSFRSDSRNSRAYPTKGTYIDVKLLHRIDWENRTGAALDLRKYFPIQNRWYFESGLHAEALDNSSGSLYFENGWGYKKTLRGYERRFSESPNFFSVRNNVKFEILKKKEIILEKLRPQFQNSHLGIFINVIADFGYSSSKNALMNSPIQDQWQYSFGLGLDVYTSYDKVIRIESTLNRQNEFNVFLHFVQPI